VLVPTGVVVVDVVVDDEQAARVAAVIIIVNHNKNGCSLRTAESFEPRRAFRSNTRPGARPPGLWVVPRCRRYVLTNEG